MRIYLQNNIDICLILNFQCILHIFTVMPLKSLQMCIIRNWLWVFFETRYLNTKKSHNHSVFIHLWRLWRSKTVDICKIHWKLMIFKSQNCFANISATKAQIFIKFETYIYKIVKNYQMIFRKNPCTYARTGGVNVRVRVSSWPNTRANVNASFALVCARILTKNHLITLYYLLNISLEIHEDRSFHCRDICKTIPTLKTHQFSIYFAYFHKFPPPKPSKMDNYRMIVGFIGN